MSIYVKVIFDSYDKQVENTAFEVMVAKGFLYRIWFYTNFIHYL